MDEKKRCTTNVKGLLREIREFSGYDGQQKFEHVVVEPARDEFDFPNIIPVVAHEILGAKGQMIEIPASIKGFRSNGYYNVKLEAIPTGV